MKALLGPARKKIDLDAAPKLQLRDWRISHDDSVVVRYRERLLHRHHPQQTDSDVSSPQYAAS